MGEQANGVPAMNTFPQTLIDWYFRQGWNEALKFTRHDPLISSGKVAEQLRAAYQQGWAARLAGVGSSAG